MYLLRVFTRSFSILFVSLLSTVVFANGIDRVVIPPDFMFEEGRYAFFSFTAVKPSLEGVGTQGFTNGVETGSVARDFNRQALAIKVPINEKFTVGVVYSQPYGADIEYTQASGGIKADFDFSAFDVLLKYRINKHFSVFGGPRLQHSEKARLGSVTQGIFSIEDDYEVGFFGGLGYTNTNYMTRVLLTYTSAISHKELQTTKSSAVLPPPFGDPLVGDIPGTDLKTPEAYQLIVRQPVSTRSVLFAIYRRANWSNANFFSRFDSSGQPGRTPGEVTDFPDVDTYTLGYGRRVTDKLALTVSGSKRTGEPAGPLTPTEGRRLLALGSRYQATDSVRLEGIVSHSWLDDTVTAQGGYDFNGNDAWAFTFRIGYQF